MAKFQPVIRKARFGVPGYSPVQMLAIGSELANKAIIPRIKQALDVHDAPAPALRPGYAKWKAKRYPPAVRNWLLTGRTLRSLKVLEAAQNKCVIGFTDAMANMKAYLNNRRARQFGVSPKDQKVLLDAFDRAESPVKAAVA